MDPIVIEAEIETKKQWVFTTADDMKLYFEEDSSWEFFTKLRMVGKWHSYMIIASTEKGNDIFHSLFLEIFGPTLGEKENKETVVIVAATHDLVEALSS